MPLFPEVAAVVIVYFPDEQVVKNIQSYSGNFAELLIIDNSPTASQSLKHLAEICGSYYHDGENGGIALRLNQACKWAKSKGFNCLLTMDQDSSFTPTNLQRYREAFLEGSIVDRMAMMGLEYSSEEKDSEKFSLVKDSILITSGSIVNLDAASEIGGFNEQYFIDEVDSEFCQRAMVAGYSIIEVKGVYLYHHLGEIAQYRSLKNLKTTARSLHSPLRIYYMIRNYLDMRSRYVMHFPKLYRQLDASMRNRIKNNLLYNQKRWQVIRMMWFAFKDYHRGRFGKFGA